MNAKRLVLTTAIAIGLTAGGATIASADTRVSAGIAIGGHGNVDIGVFYNDLSPYGRWVDRPSYGRVFIPRVSHTGWRPYSRGHWVDTDYGWTWVSDESFGWATYHYGRWYSDPDYGWVWVPGSEWGPAWVDFHEGDGYIGWAPLPPSVGFDYSYGVRSGYEISPQSYCFVPQRRFLDTGISAYALAPTRNVAIFRNTRNITNYTVVNNRVVNRSFDVRHIEQLTGRRVQRLQVAEATRPGRQQVQGGRVAFYRPNGQRAAAAPNAVARRNEQVQAQQRAAVAGRQPQRAEVERQAEARRANDAAARQGRAQVQHDRAVQQQTAQGERRQAQNAERRAEQNSQREQRVQQEQHLQQEHRQARAERQQQARMERQQQQARDQEQRRERTPPPPSAQPRSVDRSQRPQRENARPQPQNAQPRPSNRPPRNERHPRQDDERRQRPPQEHGNQ